MEKVSDSIHNLLSFCLVFFLLTSIFFLPVLSSGQNQTGYSSSEGLNKVDNLSLDHTSRSTSDYPGMEFSKNTTEGLTSNSEVDVMIAYTSEAESWASSNDGSIQNTIDEAIGNANTAMENSEIDLNINLVHTSEVDYTETGDDPGTDLQRLADSNDGYMDEVHDWRDYYGADLVSLFVERDEDSNLLGVARAPHHEGQLNSDYAFSVVSVQDISSRYVFTHEIGHNFGAGHAKDQDISPGPQLYDYSAGWSWQGDKIMYEYVSVMTYPYHGVWGSDERVLHFSNPDVYHEGDATGEPEDGDNARTIRETKDIISDYQEPTPQVDLLYPSSGEEWYEGSEQEIRWETTSGDNGVEGIDISLIHEYQENGETYVEEDVIAENIDDTGSYMWRLPNEPGSNYWLSVRATDEAGFSRNDISEFEIKEDDIPPEIELLKPTEDEILKEQELTIRWEAEDNQSGISHYEVTSDAHDWEEWLVTEQTQYNFGYLENGDHMLGVRAVDNAGNENITTVNVTIDTIDPFLEIKNPIDGDELEPGNITVEWEGYDDITGISYFEIRLDDNRWIDVGEDTSYTFDDLEEGNYTITVRAVDRAGNTVIETIEFEVKEDSIFEMTVDFVLGYWWILISILLAILLVIILLEKEEKERRSQGSPSNQVQSDFIECGGCGAVIPSDVSSCPECGVEFSDEVECINCGELVDSDLERCPECGLDFFER